MHRYADGECEHVSAWLSDVIVCRNHSLPIWSSLKKQVSTSIRNVACVVGGQVWSRRNFDSFRRWQLKVLPFTFCFILMPYKPTVFFFSCYYMFHSISMHCNSQFSLCGFHSLPSCCIIYCQFELSRHENIILNLPSSISNNKILN